MPVHATIPIRLLVICVLQILLAGHAFAQEIILDGDPIYTAVLTSWGSGNTKAAEAQLAKIGPEVLISEKTAFLKAILGISRGFVSPDSALQEVATISPESAEGKAAVLLLNILKKHDTDKRLKELVRLVEEQPGRPVLAFAVVIGLQEVEAHAEVEAWCIRTASMMNPGPPSLHHRWANALDAQKKHEEALPHRKLACDLESAAWSNAALGFTLSALRRFEEANNAYAEAVKIYPLYEHWLAWGRSRSTAGKYDDALEKFEQALKRDPKSVSALRWKAVTLQRLGRWDDALADYDRLRTVAPSDAYAYETAVKLLRSLGRDAEAEKIVDQWTKAGNTTVLSIDPAK